MKAIVVSQFGRYGGVEQVVVVPDDQADATIAVLREATEGGYKITVHLVEPLATVLATLTEPYDGEEQAYADSLRELVNKAEGKEAQ